MYGRIPTYLALVVTVSLISSCSPMLPRHWQPAQGRAHPLVGRILEVETGRFISRDRLLEELGRTDFVLLGEQHENTDHHRLQAAVVCDLIERGRRPAVAFEMLDLEDAPALETQLSEHPGDVDGIGEAVDWSRSGWPPWPQYRPVFEVAVEAGVPIVAANLSRSTLRKLTAAKHDGGKVETATEADDGGDENAVREKSGTGADAAADEEEEESAQELVKRLGIDEPLPEAVHAAMVAEISAAHCGHVSEEYAEPLVLAQRARDAQMAESLVRAGATHGAVLIAGSGHVRVDRAVPVHIAKRQPASTVAAVGFVEVAPGRRSLAASVNEIAGKRFPFDYVWFTRRTDYEDPCEKFREQLERLSRQQKASGHGASGGGASNHEASDGSTSD